MIIMMGFYNRKPGMRLEEFRRFWSEVYGPLYSKHPEIKRHIRRYIQHQLSEATDISGQSVPFDGIAEAWFDTADDIARMCDEPIYKETIGPLLGEFMDLENSHFTAYDSPVYQIGDAPEPVR